MSGEHDNHGSTPAAWTAVVIITIAFAVGTLGVMLGNWVMFWVGAGLVVLGAVVGKVMQRMGLGAHKRPATRAMDPASSDGSAASA